MTNVLVCVKRTADPTGELVLTDDGMRVDGRYSGYTTSAHEEAAVGVATGIAEATGGTVTVLSLGGEDSVEQIRAAIAIGANDGIRIDADADAYGPADVAAAIADVVRAREAAGTAYDLVLTGNDAADTGDFQVGVRLAYALGRPVATAIQTIEVDGSSATMRGEGPNGTEVYEIPLPAVASIWEGGVAPKYPSLSGRLKAKKAVIEVVEPTGESAGSGRLSLRVPPPPPSEVEILGEGPAAADKLVDVLVSLGVVSR
ncbi:electron transfer flavoprotein subunit beta/FixA family protein [Actinomycetota bacterium]